MRVEAGPQIMAIKPTAIPRRLLCLWVIAGDTTPRAGAKSFAQIRLTVLAQRIYRMHADECLIVGVPRATGDDLPGPQRWFGRLDTGFNTTPHQCCEQPRPPALRENRKELQTRVVLHL